MVEVMKGILIGVMIDRIQRMKEANLDFGEMWIVGIVASFLT